MDIEELYPEFFAFIKVILERDDDKTLNPIVEFANFLNIKSNSGELHKDYDDFSIDDFKIEATKLKTQIHHYASESEGNWLDYSNANRWKYRINDVPYSIGEAPEVVPFEITPEIEVILQKSAADIQPDELDELRDYVSKLKSQEDQEREKHKKVIAEYSYLIANVSFQASKTIKNANDWSEAADCLNGIDDHKAYECYKTASEQYSILLMYSESAEALYRALSLIKYKDLKEDKDKDNHKKDLLDCQVQYGRAGQNEKASKIFIKLNDIKSKEKNWYTKPFYYLFKVTSKYGECPGRVLLTAFIIILVATAIYTFCGIKSGVDDHGIAIIEKNLLTSFYFSFVTFTTLGYGDFAPLGWVRAIAIFQALSGLVLTSLFMVTLVRKYSR